MENKEVKILVVEDSPEIQLTLKGAFNGSSYKVIVCKSVAEAKVHAKAISFDIILLDVNLSGEDGLTLCSELQNDVQTRNIPIIVLSADPDVSQKVIAFSMGADDYLVKPVNPLELRARVASKLMKLYNLREDWESLDWSNLKKAG